ncbi:hypothetical protein [uncultured Fibrella sp.]|uniref:hypothetical protein n=1 Tax=uncultured Fibrella sp. TaxID=1284596 RepID=UPI0035C95E11
MFALSGNSYVVRLAICPCFAYCGIELECRPWLPLATRIVFVLCKIKDLILNRQNAVFLPLVSPGFNQTAPDPNPATYI